LRSGRQSWGHLNIPTQAKIGLEWATRPPVHLRRLQVRLSAAKVGARVGAVNEKACTGGICLCINRREDQGTWGLAREDARESARNHARGRPWDRRRVQVEERVFPGHSRLVPEE